MKFGCILLYNDTFVINSYLTVAVTKRSYRTTASDITVLRLIPRARLRAIRDINSNIEFLNAVYTVHILNVKFTKRVGISLRSKGLVPDLTFPMPTVPSLQAYSIGFYALR